MTWLDSTNWQATLPGVLEVLRSGGSVGSKSKATIRGCFLFAAGCRDRDCRTGSRESNGCRARQPKLRIGQNKANGPQLDCSLSSSLTMGYIMRSEKSRGGQTQSARFLHRRGGTSRRPEFTRALDLAFLFLYWFVRSFGKSHDSPSFQKRIRLDAPTQSSPKANSAWARLARSESRR
jgi:hypothetical protein